MERVHYRIQHCLSERSAPVSRQKTALPEEQQDKLIEMLNRRLAERNISQYTSETVARNIVK